MAASTTIIVALRYSEGVLICSDSQATDPVARVRWSTTKLAQIQSFPIVIGHSGSVGSAQRVVVALQALDMRPNTFDRTSRVQGSLDRVMTREYAAIRERNHPPPGSHLGDIALWSLAAVWSEGAPRIIEYEVNGESSWHDNFHAIGSGASTAYAVYRTLGGASLCSLRERAAIAAALRILETVVAVDPAGVSGPFDVWRIRASGTRRLGDDEVNTHLQHVDDWLNREKEALNLFDSTATTEEG